MTPERFKEANRNLTRPEGTTEAECGDLWVYADGVQTTSSAWRLAWRERISVLLFGRIWLGVWAGGETQPPVHLIASRRYFKGTKLGGTIVHDLRDVVLAKMPPFRRRLLYGRVLLAVAVGGFAGGAGYAWLKAAIERLAG